MGYIDKSLRVFWTCHHSVTDGWSLPLIMDRLLSICYNERTQFETVTFKDHIEWILTQPKEANKVFWKQTLANVEQTLPISLPKPTANATSQALKYKRFESRVVLPEMKTFCSELGVTPSTIFRSAWAILLQQYTRSEHVIFGSVVSGRDTGLDGIET